MASKRRKPMLMLDHKDPHIHVGVRPDSVDGNRKPSGGDDDAAMTRNDG